MLKKIYDKNNIKEIDISKKTDLLVYLIKIMSNLNNENIKFIEEEKIVTKIYNFYEFYIGKAINISKLKNTIASFQEKNNKTQSL